MVAAPSSAGNRFRQRKISTKQTLQIFRQNQISDVDNEDLQQREIQEIETGVDKNEEDEVHLQKILKNTGISNTSEAYIPTPDASKVWPEAKKYYTGKFIEPDSYIKSSCQVEDYVGCLYNMDEDDEEFLKKLNKECASKKQEPLSEDEFEIIIFNFEKVINEKQPFLVTDPHQILPLAEIKLALLEVDKSSVENINKVLADELNVHPFVTQFDANAGNTKPHRQLEELINLFGEKTYEHFKERKISRMGKSITPVLKFTGEDDSDAYICFRQRQFRQQRKTRRADTQSSDKLIRLYQELKATKELTLLVAQREQKRLDAIQTERDIFELRCKVKALKRKLGITDSDDDLVAHKKKKAVPPEPKPEDPRDKRGLSKSSNNANIQERGKQSGAIDENLSGTDSGQQFQPYVKLPPSKIPDMELETVQHLLKNKDVGIQKFVEEKLKKRKQQDVGFVNLTDYPYSPLLEVNIQNQPILDKKHTPYSSITSSFFDVQSRGYIPNIERYLNKGPSGKESEVFVYDPTSNAISKKFIPEKYNPLFQESVQTSDPLITIRKRVGRLGQVYIDRRGMIREHRFNNEDETFGGQMGNSSDLELLDAKERHEDRWKFDTDLSSYDPLGEPFSEDPAKMNSISNETQVIRFGGMLLCKSYETLKESIMQLRQQMYMHKLQRMQAQQKQEHPTQDQPTGITNGNTANRSTPTSSTQKVQSHRVTIPSANAVNKAIKTEN